MRASLITLIAFALVASPLVAACDRDDDESDDRDERIRSPQDDLEDVVAFGGDIEITIDDVEEAVHRLRLLAPGVEHGEIPDEEPEWMKNPMAQVNVVRNLVRFRIVRQAAAERDISITPADETAFIADHEPLKRYLPLLQNGEDTDALKEELEAVDLDLDDVRHLVHDMVLEEKLRDALVEEFPEQKLWAIYQQTYDEADVVVVSIANTPKSHEINRAIQQYDAEIRQFYRENRQRYTRPRRVEATLLRGGDGDESELEEAARRLADEEPDAVAEELGLVVASGVAMNPEADSDAYDADVGEVGVELQSPRGPHAWIIDDVEQTHTRELDRPLRREIGSKILREQEGITPANRETAQNAQQILADVDASGALDDDEIESLLETLEEEGFDAVHTDFFSVHGSGVIPEIGLAEQLFEAIGGLDFDDPVTEPVLDRNDVHIARLVGRNHPDRELYEEERDEFRADFLEANQHRLVDDFVRNYQLEQEVNFHLAAVTEHFGTTQKDKPGDAAPMPADEPVPAEEMLKAGDR